MKRFILFIITVIILCVPCLALATPPPFDDSGVSAVSVMLIDARTGEILYEKGQDERISPASTTKLMTALLTIENCKMEDVVIPGKEVYDFSSASSLAGIQEGENITVKDLLFGLLVVSGNDAAAALAVHIAGSLEGFNDMMNARAKELGMENTLFTNPHGLAIKDKEHYSTGSDMSKLALAAYAHPELMEIMSTKQYTIAPTNKVAEPRDLKTSNLLMSTPEKKPEYAKYLYEYATGMKTGLLQNPWYGCLVASAQRGDSEYIALIFGDDSDRGVNRWQYAIDLFDYGFKNFSKINLSTFITPVTKDENVENYAKNDPKEGLISLNTILNDEVPGETMLSPEIVQGLKDGTIKVEQETVLTKPLVAPIMNGEEMGYVSYKIEGQEICKAPLVSDRKVYQVGEEQLTKEEYNLPGIVFTWQWWYLAIIIPVVLVVTGLILRMYNLNKRKYGRRSYSNTARRISPNDNYGSRANNNANYAKKARRGRKL